MTLIKRHEFILMCTFRGLTPLPQTINTSSGTSRLSQLLVAPKEYSGNARQTEAVERMSQRAVATVLTGLQKENVHAADPR